MHLLCDGSNLPGLRMISSRAWQGESVLVRGGTRLQPLAPATPGKGYKLLVGLDPSSWLHGLLPGWMGQ